MGGEIKGKSVIYDIMEFENCQLYYLINNISQEIQMQNINAEDKENKDPYCNWLISWSGGQGKIWRNLLLVISFKDDGLFWDIGGFGYNSISFSDIDICFSSL